MNSNYKLNSLKLLQPFCTTQKTRIHKLIYVLIVYIYRKLKKVTAIEMNPSRCFSKVMSHCFLTAGLCYLEIMTNQV